MPISLADHHGIDTGRFDSTGALDPILGIDTHLFIDPRLIQTTKAPELSTSAAKIIDHFNDVLKVVENIREEGDPFWKKADKLLQFPEVKGLAIGYSGTSTNGRGMGKAKRKNLLTTIKQIVQAGARDPALFDLVGAFGEDIGPDLISDMLANIIADDLIAFTQRVCDETFIPMSEHRLSAKHPAVDLPSNPDTDEPLILVPRDVLRDLPIAETVKDVLWIAEQNQKLRDHLNKLIGTSWRQRTIGEQKHALREAFIADPKALADVLKEYLSQKVDPYDFEDDPAGQQTWYRVSKDLPSVVELKLSLSKQPTTEETEGIVVKICEHFRALLEDHQLCKLLYDKQGGPKHESAAQRLFFGVASSYCKANDLDLSPESDGGRGPVDFKISKGHIAKILVEVKLTSNKQLVHGFEAQLPIYQKAENAERGIYLVIDNGGASEARLTAFHRKVREAGKQAPRVIFVDGKPRASASKADE
jgi:hypothetical protein